MELPERKNVRLQDYDYSSGGAYFVTICTQNRAQILSQIVGGDVLDAPINVKLLSFGKIVDKYIKKFNDFYEYTVVDKYVIMPNHIHMIILIKNGASGTSPPTKQHSVIPQFVSTLKRFVNKEVDHNIFQRSFYDHIIRDQNDYLQIWQYIDTNPAKWQEDKYYN